jgi:hypothetical protein
MAFRRIALPLLVVVALTAGCGDDDDSGGVALDRPIGAPESGSTYETAAGRATTSIDADTSVVKSASVEVDVVQDELNSAAQAVIDLATASKVGGFLVSSVVDVDEGYGSGRVVVKVPAPRFEHVVGELNTVGEITRQELEGQDLAGEFLKTQSSVRVARSRTAALLKRLQRTDDPAVKFELREDLVASKERLQALQQNESYIEAQTAYSTIQVSLTGKEPPPAPAKPAFERALATAKTISVAIASGAVLAAGVIVPIGLLLVGLYLVAAPVVRRLKPRLDA